MALDSSDNNILKEGYIETRGDGMLSGWKKRYIVLYKNSGIIEYYTDDSKKQLKGTINILQHNLANRQVHIDFNNVKHGFDIECKNRTWMFRCQNDKIKQNWTDAIKLSIKQELKEIIKPSKNNTGNCEECPDFYHCCLELHINYDEWVIVWPLLKLDDKKSDENKSDGCDTNDTKILYLFDTKTDRDQDKVDKAIKTFRIQSGFVDIYEYFPFNKKNADLREYYFILNKKYVFRCKNEVQREMFIDGVCEKIYYQDDDRNKIYRIR